MGRWFGWLQKIGTSLMLPVSVLPVAGILLGVGSAQFTWLPAVVSNVMAQSGGAVFGNLPLICAIGVALGVTGNDGVAALAAVVGYAVMLATMGVMAPLLGYEPRTIMGIASIDTGVFGGILIGAAAGILFNRYFRLTLPPYLGFFAGKRWRTGRALSWAFAIARRSHTVSLTTSCSSQSPAAGSGICSSGRYGR